jgi:hypothetical protein
MMTNKGVLAIGTIIVVLNIILAMAAVTIIELMVQQFELNQKLILVDQSVRMKCTAMVRDSINQEYSRRSGDIDSIATVRAMEFYGEPTMDTYKSSLFQQTDSLEIEIIGETAEEIREIISHSHYEPSIISCDTITYHPQFSDSMVKINIK